MVLAALALTGGVGCNESVAPVLSVSRTSRSVTLPNDSVWVTRDSVLVAFAGPGAGGARWTASHGGAPWITLTSAEGTGAGFVRWTRDPADLGYGTWVDTITVTAPGAGRQTRILDSVVIGGPPPAFVTERVAWQPGERDSLIAFVTRTGAWGELTDAAPLILGAADSQTVVVPNPDLPGPGPVAATAGLPRAPRFGQTGETWHIVGFQIRELYPDSVGSAKTDSINWLGIMWYASPESSWVGRMVFGTSQSTRPRTTVNTAAFDASGETNGVGGGEARATTRQYWEANSGRFQISSNACNPASCANASFTSGPWKGGVWHGLVMGGQMITILAPCQLPAGCTSVDTFNVNFRRTTVPGVYISCVFPTPCTGPAGARLAELARRRTAADRSGFRRVIGADPARAERRAARLQRR